MSLLFSATADRVDLAAQSASFGVTRGTLLLWIYVPTGGVQGSWVTYVDPFNGLPRGNLNFPSGATNLKWSYDLATDINVDAVLTNFAAWGTGKWLCIAAQWATPTEAGGGATDQKLWMGDLTTGLAEPSAYAVQSAGSGALPSSDATSHWKIGNRRTNDLPAPGRIAYAALFNRSSGAQMTLAEMDAWRKWPFGGGAAWMHELGVDAANGDPTDLAGNGHTGTITGATVEVHPAMNPFGLARHAATAGDRAAAARRTARAHRARGRRLRSRDDSIVVVLQSGTPIVDAVLVYPITYGLAGTGTVAAAGASVDGVLTFPITYGLAGTATVVAGPAAIDGVLTFPITYGLSGAGTVQAPGSGASAGGWVVPIRLASKILRPANDLSARIGPVRGRQVSPPAWIPYAGASVTCWLARPSAPLVALGGLTKVVPLTAGAGELAIDATEIDVLLAGLSPAAAQGESFLLVVQASADFQRSRALTHHLLSV